MERRRKTPKISQKKLDKLEREGRLRDEFEIWVDRHNHKLELARTVTSVVNLLISAVLFLKLFGVI